MLLIGIKNTASQVVLADGIIGLGNVYRRYCKKNNCGVRTFETTSTGVSLQHEGIYHITGVFVATGNDVGTITVQLLENGTAIDGAFASSTIATADTELTTLVVDYYVLVDSACLLGKTSTVAKNISFANTGVDATFTSVVVNVDKVV